MLRALGRDAALSTSGTVAPAAVPRRRSSLIGRDADVAEVLDRLPGAAVVTLTGVGGVGKTRLAYEVAARVDEAGELTVLTVELASVTHAESVTRLVADRLGLAVADDRPAEQGLVDRLSAEGPCLLVLDNCEHVVDAVADLVDLLLERCPELVVLATSRERLGVEGEQVWPVQPLATRADGPTDAPTDAPAVRLLRERADAAHPGALSTVDHDRLVELAVRLDGLPLALELAAARIGSMGLGVLVDQLDGQLLQLETAHRRTADRHRSLATVVEWSYRLLDPADQQLLNRLAVFTGGFTRRAATEVVEEPSTESLGRLVEASLLTVTGRGDETRFDMLGMIREFVADRLAESGEADEIRLRHARWAAQEAAERQQQLRGPSESAAVPRFAAELDNIGAALDWACDRSHAGLIADLVRGLQDHLFARAGHEVHAWIERAVTDLADAGERGDVLLVAASAAMRRGDLARIRELMVEVDELGTETTAVWFGREGIWGALSIFEGRLDEARRHMDAWAADTAEVGPWPRAIVLAECSLPRAYGGDSVEALELADEARRLAERVGNPSALGWAAYARGEALIGVDPPRAIDAYADALAFASDADNRFLAGLLLVARASALARYGEPVEALEQFQEAIERWRDAGAWSYLSTTLRNLGELLVRLERFEEAAWIRAAVDSSAASSGVSGVDAERDRYLRSLLSDRLGSERFDRLLGEADGSTSAEIITSALEIIEDELSARRRVSEFRAIVFTDLESSTRFMANRGDEDARRIMRQYDLLTNSALARHRGERVKGTGDGVLAAFPTVSDALRCVVGLLREVDEAVQAGRLPLRVRVGVHAGETIADMGDVHGTVVNLTARVVDRAQGGEVLVTDTIRQIVVGSDLEFTSVGEADLKGIPEPMGLHRLEWR